MNCSMEIELWLKVLTFIVAAIGAGYAVSQYRRNQRWKLHDTAAAQMEKLAGDAEIALACQALDWGVGPLIIPEKYRALFRKDAQTSPPFTMEHDTDLMCKALLPQLTKEVRDSPEGLVYRYCFIGLFEYLNAIARQIEYGQIRIDDVEDLEYWLRHLYRYPYAPRDVAANEVFVPALRTWSYKRIFRLAQYWGIPTGPS